MDDLKQITTKETAWQLGYLSGLKDAVKHGRWIRRGTDPWDGADCSECGKHYSGSEWGDNYCKVCGAKMDIKD